MERGCVSPFAMVNNVMKEGDGEEKENEKKQVTLGLLVVDK